MRFNFLDLNPNAYGLDISDREIKVFGFVEKGRKNKILIMKKISLDEGAVVKGEVKDIKKLCNNFKKLFFQENSPLSRQVIVSLPEEKSFLRVIQMPKMDISELNQAVYYEAENHIPFSLESVYLDFQVLTSSDQDPSGIEVLLVAIPKKIVDPYVEAINKAGLIPVAMETEAQAMARALIPKEKEVKDLLFLANIGANRTSTGIYYENSLRFTSFIPISSKKFTETIAQAMEKKLEEAEDLKKIHGILQNGEIGTKIFKALEKDIDELADQIKRQIDYFYSAEQKKGIINDKGIRSVILSGKGSALKGLEQVLLKKLGIPVKKGDPLVNLPGILGKDELQDQQELLSYTVAIGLSLKKLEI